MGTIKNSKPVKLIAGLIYPRGIPGFMERVEGELAKAFGSIDGRSPEMEFNMTDYYGPEMGQGLMRRWVSFSRLPDTENLGGIKIKSNEIEEKYAKEGKRTVNIDPGYINDSRLVLFSTKDFSHRIYTGNGIYSEVTLIYRKGAFRDLEWTYPDYRTPRAKEFFTAVRERYLHQI